MSEIDFAPMMEGVARELWGEPNLKLSKGTEVRWGDSGARWIDTAKGVWEDYRKNAKGGVLALIKHETGKEGAEAFEWLKEKGFAIPGREDQRQPKKSGGLGELVATFEYVDERGKKLYEVCRFEDGTVNENGKRNKTFRQRHHNPSHPAAKSQGWVWSIADVRRVLYRLPQVIEAVAAGRTIVIVEGEKAVKAAVSIGLDATTNAMGANKWEEGYTEALFGADVIIIPDNDNEGRNHADLVASSLHGKAKRVRVMTLPARKEKDDIHEWVANGGTREQFFELAAQVADWRPRPPQSRFGAVEWSRMDEVGQEYRYRVKNLIPMTGVVMVGGESGSGKSFLATDIGFAVARGVECSGHKTEQGLVIYQAGEGGLGLKKRMRAYRKASNLGNDVPFVLLPGELDLHNNDDHTNAFITECKAWSAYYAQSIGMIVIDTFSTATPGANENDGGDVSKILARCSRIAKECNTVVVVVHHMNADGKKLRGHTSIRANVDSVLMVSKLEIKDADSRPIRKVELVKNKDGEDGFSWQFVLRQVVIGKDEDEEDITSCVVGSPAKGDVEHQGMQKLKLTNNDDLVYRCLKRALTEYGEEPPAKLGLPSHVKRVVGWGRFCVEVRKKWVDIDDLTITAEENERRRDDAVRKAIRRCSDRLQRLGLMDRDMDEKLVWDLGLPRWATKTERVPEPPEHEQEPVREVNVDDIPF